ncbi:16S rRNA (cytosine(1402)-N(4))-methyltransferase RsmH [Alicyclobacillus mali]|uniref:Ribosomal RNA small subunit methyltransferase H n=1 Tax=Alicyclobacillus mali (ex Roth et al. 2021) TaxID=1123961 RepID=A0ABS0F2Q3_9BACL|nr:16S rRNA (cytosine(1402)-N(4))-methyltransferase RsmH [Alicyclobacillus mali (ex Roth et al. 2021)]MBF8377558.1 16S rRNA (cytosine(1402)-N(4))-methyltransferase RsmH [Alicyclobacillus mali (ex Roth et al. 2021)]MCL6487520.1 16S rRNA (cytosine(1402)-N(4))-methyltransferase RsmH [Alicyclobacillus mali (ex Roth et al. 2021)]
MNFAHETVLLEEAVDALAPRPGGVYVDATLGGAGHTARLLERSAPDGVVIAFDQDEAAIAHAAHLKQEYPDRLTLVKANFAEMEQRLRALGVTAVDGVLFDLGVSSPQFDLPERGFSYWHEGPLDMRMDRHRPLTAREIVNTWDERELARILREYGEERFSLSIARAIARARSKKPIETTTELAEIVKGAIPAAARRAGPHPARRTFQAIRIAVNDELGVLASGVEAAFRALKPGGRLSIITFHSLEDRVVKRLFQTWAQGCICPPEFPVCRCGRKPLGRMVSRKPVTPSSEELERNPRARSAKLRAFEKLDDGER